jgi:RNA polymerase sigma-70 factor (ECF subfamily)
VRESSDRELFEAWAGGDREAGEFLFERHFEPVARFFRNKADQGYEDLIQRTFLGCIEARDRFRQDASFRTFLFAVARNVLSKHYREQRRDIARLDFGVTSIQDMGASPSFILAQDQEQQLMLAALRAIPLDSQIVLELHYWESMTAAEVGEMLEVPLGTAKTRIRRAKQLLAAELGALSAGQRTPDPTGTGLDTWAVSLKASLF